MSSVEAARVVGPGTRRQPTLRPTASAPTSQGLLPVPPSDVEKYAYAKRRLPVLAVSSLVSIGCLMLSQFRLASSTPCCGCSPRC